jgi:hypothetical protein
MHVSRLVPHALAVASLTLAPRVTHAAKTSSEEKMERLRQAEVVVVRGSADHMEQVMARAQLKYVAVDPSELPQLPLHGQQVLMVNCMGQMSPEARERVRRFVNAGGLLYTTDHAVHYLVEKIFPGYIAFRGKISEEEIFPMETAGDQGLLKKIGTGGHPRWQLAGGGYLFDVVDRQKVEVLMRSKAVGARYGTPVLGVRFRVGDGQVIHVTGHFFTQPGQRPEEAAAGRAFEQMSANVVDEKRGDNGRLDRLYNVAPKRPAIMREAPAAEAAPVAAPADFEKARAEGKGAGAGVSTAPATRVRVLEKKNGFAKVRDTQGNEGWVDEDSL